MAKITKATDSKKPDTDDEDEDVLFEGELTWTHDPEPVSPELLMRTPRDAEPDAKPEHVRHPSEGSIELSDLKEGGGEIFDIEVDTEPAEEPVNTETADTVAADDSWPEDAPEESSGDGPIPDSPDKPAAAEEPVAAASAEEEPEPEPGQTEQKAHSSGHGHGLTVEPLNGFSKAALSESDPFAVDQASMAPSRMSARRATASQFAAEQDPAADNQRRSQILIMAIVTASVLVIAAGLLGYLFYIVPNRPDSVLAKALGTTLQQPSVQLSGQATEQTPAKQTVMQTTVSGGISQAGSFDLSAKVVNLKTTTPLLLSARSIDGREAYIQGSSLAANLPYLTQLGIPATATATLQGLENKWVRLPAEQRPNLATGLGLDAGSGVVGANDKQTLVDIYKQDKFLNVVQTMPDVALDGTLMHHYQVGLNKTKLTAFLLAARSKVSKLGITQAQITAANQLNTGSLKIEVWIDGDTSLIAQISVVKQKTPNTISWVLRLSNYGKTLELQQPSTSTDVVSSLKQMISPTATDAQGQALLTKILSNYSTAAQPATANQ